MRLLLYEMAIGLRIGYRTMSITLATVFPFRWLRHSRLRLRFIEPDLTIPSECTDQGTQDIKRPIQETCDNDMAHSAVVIATR